MNIVLILFSLRVHTKILFPKCYQEVDVSFQPFGNLSTDILHINNTCNTFHMWHGLVDKLLP